MKSSYAAILFLVIFFLPCNQIPASSAEDQLTSLISSGGYVVMAGRKEIAEYRSSQPFIPASTIKIATTLAALEILGASQRFKTEFYLRDKTILTIKGYGDPFLTSEYIPAIAAALKQNGIRTISEVILDESFFRLSGPADGSRNSANPYDAINAALAVNFNSLPLLKYDTGSIASGEMQTPVLPLMKEIGGDLEAGRHRLNVSAFARQNGISNVLRYTAELFISIFQAEGIKVSGSYRAGTIGDKDILVYTHRSHKTTTEVVRGCLRYSNNFIANQLFLLIGVKRYGPPATWKKAREAMKTFLQSRLGLGSDLLHLVEGSGLSRNNRATPALMIAVLEAFKPYAALLPENSDVIMKSGTLSEVHNYAGYFKGKTSLDPFVIFLNQPINNRKQILSLLRGVYRGEP